MIDQETRSPEAEAEGSCHTRAECDQMYVDLPAEIKAPAIKLLAEELSPAREEIQKAYQEDPEHWIVPYHHSWGTDVRNLLRQRGFGEGYFSIHNLDDIYVSLVEEALELGH